jgi:hypothetical protein
VLNIQCQQKEAETLLFCFHPPLPKQRKNIFVLAGFTAIDVELSKHHMHKG